MKKIIYSFVWATAIFLMTECTPELLPIPSANDSAEEESTVHFHISRTGHVKSSISPDENKIRSVRIMAYRAEDGILISELSLSSATGLQMKLTPGVYNIYAIANIPSFSAPISESEIGMAKYELESFGAMKEMVPMCWKGRVTVRSGRSSYVTMIFERLISKVAFQVDMGAIEGLKISSLRLRQGARVIRPFMRGGSRILSSSEASDGDYATPSDISELMQGKPVCFYVTENCQGDLLPGNTDPWAKIPDNIEARSGLCTYVEMKCTWLENAEYEGEVTYRFYLGEDAVSNFDISRNTSKTLSLYLEEDSFERISWKIDASQMGHAQWNIYSDFEDNFHNQYDFYTTERIVINFELDEKAQNYWEKRDNDFYLAGVDSNGETVVRFNVPTSQQKGKFYALGTCIGKGDFEVHMINGKTGDTEYIMNDGTVLTPSVVAAPENDYTDNLVEGFEEDSEITINGGTTEICLYLIDKEGYNLNQGHYYGCDFSLCSWNTEVLNEDYGFELTEGINIECIDGDTGSDGYAVKLKIKIENTGDDSASNRRLTGSLGRNMLKYSFTDTHSGATGSHYIGLYCDDVSITFRPVPADARTALGSEFMYAVNNSSNLPVCISGVKMNSLRSTPAGMWDFIYPGLSGLSATTPLLLSGMPEIYCSKENGDAKYIVRGDETWYAADDNGITQDMIPDQYCMFHTFDVHFKYQTDYWLPGFKGKIDMTSTSSDRATYGTNGYRNCGFMFYSDNGNAERHETYTAGYTDFQEYGNLLDRKNIRKINDIVEIELEMNSSNQVTAKASKAITVKAKVSGILYGHIRCVTVQDPLYTVWGHYFKHGLDFSSRTVTYSLGTDPTVIDESAITQALEDLRKIELYSLLDAWSINDFYEPYEGNPQEIREYLKPYGLDLEIELVPVSDVPLAVRFNGELVYDYKISQPVTWPTGLFSSATMVPSSYSGFDDGLDDDDCPPGKLFKAETVTLRPEVTYTGDKGIYYMSK